MLFVSSFEKRIEERALTEFTLSESSGFEMLHGHFESSEKSFLGFSFALGERKLMSHFVVN